MKTKLIQKIKEEFYEDFAKPYPYGNIMNGHFEYVWDPSKPSPDTIWKFIEKAISQSKEELVEEKRKTEYKILKVFMEFMRNGHNLKEHDLDRIESEWALFESRNYTDLFLEDLNKK